MARGRMISKSLGSSRRFHATLAVAGRLGEFAQLLFTLIVTNTDDHGRMPGDAFTVKHLVLPTSPRSLEAFGTALDALADVDLIKRYQVDGVIYLQVNDFDAHQVGLHKRRESRLPVFPDTTATYRELPLQEKGTEGKGTEGNRKGTEGKLKAAAIPPSPSAPDESDKNIGVITKIAHEVIDIEGVNALPSVLADAVKSLCAIRDIDYGRTSTIVRKAVDSALAQRRLRFA